MVEITDSKEYRRVMSEETVHVVRMAMRYEHTPKTSVDAERCKAVSVDCSRGSGAC